MADLAQGPSIYQVKCNSEFFEDSGRGLGRKVVRKPSSLTSNVRYSENESWLVSDSELYIDVISAFGRGSKAGVSRSKISILSALDGKNFNFVEKAFKTFLT